MLVEPQEESYKLESGKREVKPELELFETSRISSFSEIDKNEEIPAALDYKSTTNFTHGNCGRGVS